MSESSQLPQAKCWCRVCKQDKIGDEMFAAVVHPDGVGRGTCIQCFESGGDVKRWRLIDEQHYRVKEA